MQSGDFKALVQSVLNEDSKSVQYYLSGGVDPNFIHPEIMTTPLIEAVRINNFPITKLLLESSAKPELVSPIGELAIQLAYLQKNQDLIALLKKRKKLLFSFHQIFKKGN